VKIALPWTALIPGTSAITAEQSVPALSGLQTSFG
jgi:hypothetical protein